MTHYQPKACEAISSVVWVLYILVAVLKIVSKTEEEERGIWDMVLVEGGYYGAEESDGT